MKNTDKVLIAFLVSMGLFSVLQANQYVKALTSQEKDTLIDVQMQSSDMDTSNKSACSIDGGPCQGGDNEH